MKSSFHLRPFFSYYGSKYLACQKGMYPEPEYDTIIEPFAGAAGYSLKFFQKNVRLYDIDERIYGIWSYLLGATPAEIRRLPDVVEHIDDVKAPQEAKWLIGYWLARGQSSPRKYPSPWMRTRAVGARFYWGAYVRGMIAHQLKYIHHWKVFNKSYESIGFDRPATWYIDPPYCAKPGRHYKCNKVDFKYLAKWCRVRKGQVMVCEMMGADWLPFVRLKDINNTVKKGGKAGKSREVIWCRTDRHRGFINIWDHAHGRI